MKYEVCRLKSTQPNEPISQDDHNDERVSELEEVFRCLKHEFKQLKERPVETLVSAPVSTPEQVDLSPLKNDVRCLKYEVKRIKEHPVKRNSRQQPLKNAQLKHQLTTTPTSPTLRTVLKNSTKPSDASNTKSNNSKNAQLKHPNQLIFYHSKATFALSQHKQTNQYHKTITTMN